VGSRGKALRQPRPDAAARAVGGPSRFGPVRGCSEAAVPFLSAFASPDGLGVWRNLAFIPSSPLSHGWPAVPAGRAESEQEERAIGESHIWWEWAEMQGLPDLHVVF
jgi:hypothetical protein